MNKVAAAASSPFRTIGLAGGAAGLFDFIFASGQRVAGGGSALDPWKGVAGGLIGPGAREGGVMAAALGAGLHFLICFVAAACLYVVLRRWPWFAREVMATSIIFGVLFLLAMNWIILPLSAIGRPIYESDTLHVSAFWHVVLIGMPMTLFISRDLAGREFRAAQ